MPEAYVARKRRGKGFSPGDVSKRGVGDEIAGGGQLRTRSTRTVLPNRLTNSEARMTRNSFRASSMLDDIRKGRARW